MGLLAKFATVGGATMASRVLGFVREALIASALGAGPVADAFYAAFRFPNMFRRLFAEGAFNAAFVPLFSKQLEGGGREAAREFAEQVLSVLMFALLLISALAMIFTPFLVGTVIAPRFAEMPAKFDLTVTLTRIMFPYLAAMSLVAMLSGILNSFRRYFLAAMAPVVLNVVVVSALLAGLASRLDALTTGHLLAWAVTASGVLQLGMLVVGVRRQDFGVWFRMPRFTPQVKRMLVLAAPAAAAGGITQINLLIGQIIASAQDGAIALLSYADRIYQLPLGVIGIAVGVVLLPELSRVLKAEDHAEASRLQNRSLEFSLGLTVPAAVGLALMPAPIIALLFERGAFTRETTELTAAALMAFAPGLPAFVLIKVFSPGFFAREDMKSPMWFSAASVAVNVAGSLLLFPHYGHVGIAMATAAAGWVNALLLGAALWIRRDFRPSATTLRRLVLIALGSVLMGAVVLGALHMFREQMLASGLVMRILSVVATITVAAGAYFCWVLLTGAVEKDRLMALVRRGKKK